MKKYIIILSSLAFCSVLKAQDNISPAASYKGFTFIKNGTIHTGTGLVLTNTSILINNGKIKRLALI